MALEIEFFSLPFFPALSILELTEQEFTCGFKTEKKTMHVFFNFFIYYSYWKKQNFLTFLNLM